MNRKGLASAVFLLAVAGWAGWRSAIVRGSTATAVASPQTWNRAAAASYLDSRELYWQQWPSARRDHGTICISCHTQLPYAMARPALGRQLNEPDPPAAEKIMMGNVEYRVSHWTDVLPFYDDDHDGVGKTAESHATEAVLNATILTSSDTFQGVLRPITQKALDEAWALQQQTGALAGSWQWQDFRLAPWESRESGYQGAALFLIAVERAPGRYAQESDNRGYLEALRSYLRRNYAVQPVVNQLYVLWADDAAAGLLTPKLLSADQRKSLLQQIQSLQQSDGGWSLSSMENRSWLDRLRHPDANPSVSDGYATGLAVLVLEDSGTDPGDETVRRGLAWLRGNQQKTGNWVAASVNEPQDPESNVGKFMSDAATGYAVLALQQADSPLHR